MFPSLKRMKTDKSGDVTDNVAFVIENKSSGAFYLKLTEEPDHPGGYLCLRSATSTRLSGPHAAEFTRQRERGKTAAITMSMLKAMPVHTRKGILDMVSSGSAVVSGEYVDRNGMPTCIGADGELTI